MKVAIASTFAAAMLAASSLAFSADNNGGKNPNDQTIRDQQTTGSINSEGRTVSPEERELCLANPSDSKCQGLGGETDR